MPRFLALFFDRLDSVYRGRSFFVGLKARLFLVITLLLLVAIAFNVLKVLWLRPPQLLPRIVVNLAVGIAASITWRRVLRGKLESAGNGLALAMVLILHAVVFLIGATHIALQPLSVGFQIFAFDLVFLLFGVVFASRLTAVAVYALIVAGHFGFHLFILKRTQLDPAVAFAADTLLRDGLLVTTLIFALGLTLVELLKAAHRRSEESLRQTLDVKQTLERRVTERTLQLETATRQANAASLAKSEFLANMSHEIRTPLNGIIASADLMKRRTDLSSELRGQVRIVSESGDILLKLLSDILDFSKIEAGRFALEKHSFGLRAAVDDTMALMGGRAAEGMLQVDVAIDPSLVRHFEGDSHRLRQVLFNLVGNAIKFTPAGGQVQVLVSSEAPGADPTLVRFEVRDTGIGMDEATVGRIFQRFTQADSSTTRRFGGSGLGLAISHRLVEMMGGRLQVSSSPGKGSTFYFTIPLRPVEAAAPASPAGPEQPVSPLNLRVLVAEDNAVNQAIIGAQLTQLGCMFSVVVDGVEVLAALRSSPLPDVILMDCHMPNMDGWETTRRIRDGLRSSQRPEQQAATLPVIALTAAAEERERCRAAGMDNFLTKPVKLAELHDVLQPYARTGGLDLVHRIPAAS